MHLLKCVWECPVKVQTGHLQHHKAKDMATTPGTQVCFTSIYATFVRVDGTYSQIEIDQDACIISDRRAWKPYSHLTPVESHLCTHV